MKKLLTIGLVAAAISVTATAVACFACGSWATWGDRLQVCAAPSEQLLLDNLSCICEGACATPCADWCSDLGACSVSGDPSCIPGLATDECNRCIVGVDDFSGIGCKTTNDLCSADATGCIPCSQWLSGGDPLLLCPNEIADARAVGECACASCGSCAAACTQGYLDVDAASFACGACLGVQCSAPLTACQ